jgi:acyl-CoA synthetase (AMP-forming)/AMP-acid ligase II
LRTGDLGFVLDGSLFVTGRLKDLIVLNGKKIAPQDIEEHCERAHTALRQGGGAAFAVEDAGVERLVIVFEVKREWVRRFDAHAEVRHAMKSIVMNEFALPVSEVALLPPGALPSTSSGKVRRSKCRLDYLDGTLERIEADAVA